MIVSVSRSLLKPYNQTAFTFAGFGPGYPQVNTINSLNRDRFLCNNLPPNQVQETVNGGIKVRIEVLNRAQFLTATIIGVYIPRISLCIFKDPQLNTTHFTLTPLGRRICDAVSGIFGNRPCIIITVPLHVPNRDNEKVTYEWITGNGDQGDFFGISARVVPKY